MAEVVYLEPHEKLPVLGDEERWLLVEANDEGGFYGSGWSRKPNGESVFYGSPSENDVNLERALAAAKGWAEKYSVPKIWVQREPWMKNEREH
ncbi:hypothetical protein P8R33_10655 [Qipengyuania sp. XHP0211]|uniref:hypothetical protein n=1 Tax=Qipengyuania sp. XHP0211 TaxID=3038079 RepID=UPI00241C8A43|nr:hypothetical protein [Qipengyuania sp. XHP0211]MDG5751567.1 hypothetical protein [Qipengyuania sp. XHP0211]